MKNAFVVLTLRKMDDKWFKEQQKRVGVTAEDIASKMGRDRSAVSHIYSGQRRMSLEWAQVFADVLQVSIDDVLKRAGVFGDAVPRSGSFGFSDGDAVPWVGRGVEAERTSATARSLNGDRPGVDVWRIDSDALSLMGYIPGDMLLVDTHQSERCAAGDVVIAQKYNAQTGSAITLLRRYEPPVLVAASMNAKERRVDFVDGINVLIRGKVIASWRI